MAALLQLFTLSNPVFKSYAFYGTIVLVKMMMMSLLTSARRFQHGIFANTEDAKWRPDGKKKVSLDNENVERVRRNHLNDLENIPAFLLLGLLYVAINPSLNVALWHFRVFAASRILHTIIYQVGVQPYRAFIFTIGVATCMSMAYQIIAATVL